MQIQRQNGKAKANASEIGFYALNAAERCDYSFSEGKCKANGKAKAKANTNTKTNANTKANA